MSKVVLGAVCNPSFVPLRETNPAGLIILVLNTLTCALAQFSTLCVIQRAVALNVQYAVANDLAAVRICACFHILHIGGSALFLNGLESGGDDEV